MISIFIGLIPAIIWGIMPTVLYYVKGKASEQLLGTTLGTLLVSVFVFLWFHPNVDLNTIFLGFFSGISWSIGQYGQYWAYQRIGVSKTFPVSTGLQIIGNTLIGGLLFGEWKSTSHFLFGFLGIALILVGLIFGNLIRKSRFVSKQTSTKIVYVILVLTTVGYWGYSAFPKMIEKGNPVEILLFQAIGMTLTACLLAKKLSREDQLDWKRIGTNTLTGTLFGIAAGTYLISMSINGLVNAFLLSQLNMIIATLLGIYWLKEQMIVGKLRTFLGLIFILVGSAVVIILT